MRTMLAILVLLLALPLLAQAECTSCGKDRSEDGHGGGCKCPSFKHYTGDADLNGVRIEATGKSNAGDELHLLLRDAKMHVVADIVLQGPHSGEMEYDGVLDMSGADLEMAILSNNSKVNVAMSFLRITGIMSDGTEFVYFEQECPGVVLGSGGCPRMVLYDGGME